MSTGKRIEKIVVVMEGICWVDADVTYFITVLGASTKKSVWMTQTVGHKVLALIMVARLLQQNIVTVMLAGSVQAVQKVSSKIQ